MNLKQSREKSSRVYLSIEKGIVPGLQANLKLKILSLCCLDEPKREYNDPTANLKKQSFR